jgi:STE24 endopeptidase
MGGSLMVMLLIFGWAGRWEPVLVLTWLASGAAMLTRPGERTVVRLSCGFHALSGDQQAFLGPTWQVVRERCGVPVDAVDLYVQRSREPNAFAAGGRSVAVTTGAVAALLGETLTNDHLSALLAHELGHHGKASRMELITEWLAAPWRIVSRFVFRIGVAARGRRSRSALVIVVGTAVVVAIVQAIQRQQLIVAVVLGTLAACGLLCPLADAALSRRAELAADQFAAEAGYGQTLAAALRRLDVAHDRRRSGLVDRALTRHPSTERRLDHLREIADADRPSPR